MTKRKASAPAKQPLDAVNNSASKYRRIASIGLFVLGFLLYANTLFFDYTVDDAIVIYDNEFTCKGTAGYGGLLKYDTFRGFFKVEGKDKLVSGGRYRPLTPLMYATEVQLFSPKKKDLAGQPVKDKQGDTVYDPNEGGKLNAVKFVGHLINVLLYGLTGVLVFWFLLKILSPDGKPTGSTGFGPFVALAAAALFVAHPIHTEVVANVKGRDEIVSLLGSLAALYLSLKAFYEGKNGLNVAAAVAFFLALLSKENAITFLAIVPLTYWFFTKANAGKIVVQTLPFVAGAAVFLAIRFAVLGADFGGAPRELMNNPFLKLVGNQYVDFSFAEKTATNFFTLGKYLLLLLFPHPLSHDYYPRAIEIMSFGDWQVILAVLAHLGLLVFALVRLPKRDILSYAILFYLVTLSIASNFIFPIGTNMNERFLYMPSIGFALLVGVLVYRMTGSWGKPKVAVMAIGGLVILALGAKTVSRNAAWKDNFTLFTTDIKTVPNSAKLRNATGGELVAQSLKPENAARKNEMLREAVGHLTEAMKIHPGYKNPLLIMGNAYNYLQEYEASIQAYEQALKLDPDYTEAQNNLAITYRQAGQFFGEKKGDIQKAFTYLNKAYELNPNEYETLRLLGVANGVSGNSAKAIEFFTKALEREPKLAAAHYNLASAYGNAGQVDKAQEFMAKARELNPNIEAEMRGGK
jgi:tetratricopeptide (TPR) repeat protein